MRKLIVINKFTITGRGQVFMISMKDNNLDVINVGDKFEVDDQIWSVKSVEDVRRTDMSDLTVVGLMVTKVENAQV